MTYEIEPKRNEIRWDLYPLLFEVLKGREKTPIPKGANVTTYYSTPSIEPEPFLLGPTGTGRGMLTHEVVYEWTKVVLKPCVFCGAKPGQFHDEFAHFLLPQNYLPQRVWPGRSCDFKMRLIP